MNRNLRRSEKKQRRRRAKAGAVGPLLQNAVDAFNQGDVETALTLSRKALKAAPGNVDALKIAGFSAFRMNRSDDAARYLSQRAKRTPDDVEAWSDLGGALLSYGKYSDAETAYREVLVRQPEDAAALSALGQVLRELDRSEEAEAVSQRAVEIDPNDAQAHNNLGLVLDSQGRYEEALEVYRKAVRLEPDFPEAQGNFEASLLTLLRYDEMAEIYQSRIADDPADHQAWLGLGAVYRDTGRFEEAEKLFRDAAAAAPDDPGCWQQLSSVQFLRGDLEEGWRSYSHREFSMVGDPDRFHQPSWRGEDLTGKGILVRGEQGVGDEVSFSCFLLDLHERGADVVYECNPRLVDLFRRSFPEVTVIAARDETAAKAIEPRLDYQIQFYDLGFYLRKTFGDFPARQSYIRADEDKTEAFRQRYRKPGTKLVVGLAWRSVNPRIGRKKSVAPSILAPLTAVPGIRFIDLQYGDTEADLAEIKAETGVDILHDHSFDQIEDLDTFAAQVAALDLVISISNTTVHMAGALGIPTWVLVPYVPFWRWFMDRDDSPWYPSARVIRQAEQGDWAGVVERARQDLTGVAGSQR